MKIAYFSPLNPLKSGISDFSEELLPYLKQLIDIDIFVSGYKPQSKFICNNFNILDTKEYDNENVRKQYDTAIFHIGNNYECHKEIVETFLKYGGILELHDISLHHYLAEDTIVQNNCDKYIEIMKYCHGIKGEKVAKQFLEGNIVVAPWENRSLEFTVCKHLIDKAEGVIVHSDFAKQMVKGMRSNAKVINIPLHTPEIIKDIDSVKYEAKQKLNISQDTIVIGAFGHATSNKRIIQIIDALDLLKKSNFYNFQFYIVGKLSDINLDDKLINLGLNEYVTVTGYTHLDDFKLYMNACDICFNLRYPIQGESSASLHRMLGLGKTVIVTQIGNFEEYPNDIVLKVRYNEDEVLDIYNKLVDLITDPIKLRNLGKRALVYAKENYDLKTNSIKYFQFIISVISGKYIDNYVDTLIDKLYEMKFINNYYIDYLNNKLDNICI